MNGDAKFWLIFWAMALTAFVTVVVSCTAVSYRRDVRMAELGYQEKPVMRQQSVEKVWIKVGSDILDDQKGEASHE